MQFSSYPLNTRKFAANHLAAEQTVRKNYCLYGHYHGIRPLKLANGRLAWPDAIATADGVKEAV